MPNTAKSQAFIMASGSLGTWVVEGDRVSEGYLRWKREGVE